MRENDLPTERILIDCDPGHDDAAAILYAARHLDLAGITTVFGNNSLEATTRNALSVLALAGLDIPVHMGAGRPLSGVEMPAGDLHGKTGLDGAALPEPVTSPHALSAGEAILRHAEAGPLGIIALGPLTNLAQALEVNSGLTERIAWISLMGGTTGVGNSTSVAEFNIYCDPEAADIVFRSGLPIRMAGLNVTRQVGVGEEEIVYLRSLGGRLSTTFAGLFEFYLERSRTIFRLQKASLHDACAVVPLVHPDLIGFRKANVVIELVGRHTRGMTVCDFRGVALKDLQAITRSQESNVEVAVEVNGEKVVRKVFEAIASF
ncbi:MAG: nucleoside hydrolase [Rhodobacteraceae bacterium]|nr:nucleoside hydrolase [Paracoccaceae bacterium]